MSRDKVDKEGIVKNRLEFMFCVVLIRVKEKEGKVIDYIFLEKFKVKFDNDIVKFFVLD